MLASQIAAAMERTRLYLAEQRRRQRAEALGQISATLATALDIDQGLETALAQLEKLVVYDYASIALFQEGLSRIRAWRGFGPDPQDVKPVITPIAITELKTLEVLIASKQALLIGDTAESDLWRSDILGGTPTRCWIGAPLIVRDVVIGALMVDHRTPGVYGPDDRDAVAALANYLAAAIENARLRAQTLRQVHELTALYETSLDISAKLQPEVLLEVVVQRAVALLNARGGGLYLYDPIGDRLRMVVSYNLDRDYSGTVLERGEGLCGQTLIAGLPLTVEDYSAWEGRPFLFYHVSLRAVVTMPLRWQNTNVGVLFIADDVPGRTFNQEEIELLSRLAAQATIAIANLDLYTAAQRRAEQLRLVNEVAQHMTGILHPTEVSAEVTRRICETFHYYAVAVCLVEGDLIRPSAGVVRQAGVRGQGSGVGEEAPTPEIAPLVVDKPLRVGREGIIGHVAATGKPLLVSDVEHDPYFMRIPELPLTASELAVPLTLGGQVIGVLDIQSDRTGAFDQTDLETMQALAGQLSIAIANARLFEAARAHAAELEKRVAARTAEIRAQQERIEAILHSVADAVIVTDLEGRVVLTNPSAEALLLSDGDEQNGRADLSADHWSLASAVAQLVRKLATAPSDAEHSVETVEGAGRVLQAHAARVLDDGRTLGTVITLRDITRLRELDRLKSQFVSNVSHELRTPLSNIKLYLSLLAKGRPERRGDYLSVLEREAARLERLIQGVLDLSRLESAAAPASGRSTLRREPVMLDEVIAGVLEAQRVSAESRRLTVTHIPSPDAPPVMADRNQLIQVFTNLLTNAILYTPEHGAIEVSTRCVQRSPAEEQDASSSSAAWAVVSVRDTGIGIPPDALDRIFDRFYRSPRAEATGAPGTGLGLAIVKEIVDLHGGHVEVESEVGVGSTFSVWLPV
jgi:PAS domain S-box-containing protein